MFTQEHLIVLSKVREVFNNINRICAKRENRVKTQLPKPMVMTSIGFQLLIMTRSKNILERVSLVIKKRAELQPPQHLPMVKS